MNKQRESPSPTKIEAILIHSLFPDIFHSTSYQTKNQDMEEQQMNKIQEFFNEKFGTVRTITIDDVIYFVASDIARALGYKNPQKAIRDHCKRVNESFIPSNGGEQKQK